MSKPASAAATERELPSRPGLTWAQILYISFLLLYSLLLVCDVPGNAGWPAWLGILLVQAIVWPALYLLHRQRIALIGPLFSYEMVRLARQGRTTALRCLYGLFLLAALALAYLDRFGIPEGLAGWFAPVHGLGANAMPLLGMAFFSALLVVQSAAVCVLTPAYLAGAIHDERDGGTLEVLFTTQLHEREIVLGKLLACTTHLGGVLLTGLPVLCLILFWGGVDARLLVTAFAATGLSLLSAGSVSLCCSVCVRGRLPALVLSYTLLSGSFLCCLPTGGYVPSPWHFLREVNRRVYSRIPDVDSVLVAMLEDYALLHGLIAIACTALAVRQLRNAARSTDEGPVEEVQWFAQAPLSEEPTVSFWEGASPVARAIEALFPVQRVGDDPLLWKEVHFGSRHKASWARPVLLLTLFAGTLFILVNVLMGGAAQLASRVSGLPATTMLGPREMNVLVRSLVVLYLALLCVGAGFLAAGTVSREREQRTLDSLLCLPLERDAILQAKWLGSLLWMRPFAYLLGAVLVVGTITPALHPLGTLLLVLAGAVHAAFVRSLGLWLSLVCRTTRRATVTLALVVLCLVASPWVVLVYSRSAGALTGSWLANFLQVGLNPLGAWWFLGFAWGESMSKTDAALAGLIVYAAAAWLFWKLACRRFRASYR